MHTMWIIPIAGLRYSGQLYVQKLAPDPLVSTAAGTWIYKPLSLAALLWLLMLWSLPVRNTHIYVQISPVAGPNH